MIRNVGVLQNVWKLPELKKRILYTLGVIAIYRIGAHIPTPFIDPTALAAHVERERQGLAGGLFNVVDLFSGQAFTKMSIMALGIMPYISVSIIIQLLTVVFPRLQKMMQEGVLGQRKINRMTRKWTIVLAAFQAFALAQYLVASGLTKMSGPIMMPTFYFTTIVAMTAGTAFVMWLGERITDQGIGNGMSLIIGAGIMCSYPAEIVSILNNVNAGIVAGIWIPIIAVLFAASAVAIIYTAEGSRRIPMQQAKRQVGRQTMQGGTNYLPLKINQANVIPVIFASALLALPSFLGTALSRDASGGLLGQWFALSSPYNAYAVFERFAGDLGYFFLILKSFNAHNVLFAFLVFGICFLYTAVTFNVDDVANNLKKSGSFIPGKQPGKRTSEYLDFVMTRVTTIGATFLTTIAVLPTVLHVSFGMPVTAMSFVGGTGLIIVIGVLLDTLRQIESQLMMRHYEGHAQRRTATPRWR